MKFLIFIFLIISFHSIAQEGGLYKVKYTFEIPSEDQGSLQKNAVLYYDVIESLFVYDKSGQDTINTGTEVVLNPTKKGLDVRISPSDEKGKIVYRNFNKKNIWFRVNGLTPIEPFVVHDDWIEIDWKLYDEYKKIKKFTSQKAVGQFRGRTYTVWFTKEIPVPYGPWKLFGLPGLILEAVDSRGQVKITFNDMEVCEVCDEINKPLEKEEKSLIEYVNFMDNLLENVESTMQSKISANKNITITLDNAPSNKEKIDKREFRIERRYRWEPGYSGKKYENKKVNIVPIDN